MKKTLITGMLLASTMLMAQNHTNYELRYPTNPEVRISKKHFGFNNRIKAVPLYAAFCISK